MIEPLKEGELENMTADQKQARLEAIMKLESNYDNSFTDDIKDILETNNLHHSDVEKIHNEIVEIAKSYFGDQVS